MNIYWFEKIPMYVYSTVLKYIYLIFLSDYYSF